MLWRFSVKWGGANSRAESKTPAGEEKAGGRYKVRSNGEFKSGINGAQVKLAATVRSRAAAQFINLKP